MQQVKIKPVKAFTQFELTQNLLQNLNKFNLGSTAKLVLMYLSSCYNPKHSDMFPKQKTIASKLGISERSVVRAIQELVNEGLIIIECKYSNHYKFTSKIACYCPVNMSDDKRQDDTKQDAKLSHHEQIKRTNKEPLSVSDYKILKKYAISKGANNVQAYIKKLISSGSASVIIREHKKAVSNNKAMVEAVQKQIEANNYAIENRASMPQCFKDLRKKISLNSVETCK